MRRCRTTRRTGATSGAASACDSVIRSTSPSTRCPTPSIRRRAFWPRPTPASPPTNRPIPITDDWIDPYRVERIYKSLDGRDQLTPEDMLAVQTDIYSEVDQEMGHRFAYAIDHTPGPEGNGDPELRQAADLMRSWDGRLTTDSAAASIVTQTRAALWPMILEPKLGKACRRLPLGRVELCPGRDRDARQARVASQGIQELGRAAHRGRAQRHARRKSARRSGPVDLRKLARRRCRASAGRASSLH